MKNIKSNKILNVYLIMLIIVILVVPKINIISISGSRNGIRIDDIFIAIYAIILLYRMINKKIKINKSIKIVMTIFGIYIFINMVSTTINCINGEVGIVLSLLYVIRKIEYFILFFAGIDYYNTCKNKNDLLTLLNTIVIFHAIYSIFEYTNIIGDIGYLIGRPNNDRIYSTFSGPYEFSAFFSMMSCIYIVNIFKNKNYIYIPLLLISVLEILVSQSRISLLAVFGVAFISVLYYLKDSKKRFMIGAFIILISIIFVVLINFTDISFLGRFKELDLSSSLNTFKIAWDNTDYNYYKETGEIKYVEKALDSSSDLSYVFRVSKWATLLKETLKSPLIGLGPSIVGEGIDGNFVRIICETGLLGIITWLVLIVYILKKSWKNRKNIFFNYIFFIVTNLSIIAIFIDIFEASKIMPIFWFILGTTLIQEESKRDKIKIVHVLSGVNFGGVESVLYNYFSNMKNNEIENVIVSHEKINSDNAQIFEQLGFKLYTVTPKRKSLVKNFVELKKLVRKENPDILHVHMTSSSYMALLVGCVCNVNVRICHSHLSFPEVTAKDQIYNLLCKMFSNVYMACSEDAGKYLFGNRNIKNKKVIILRNAIQMERFKYNEDIRDKLRKELNLQDKFIIGNIGRFTEQKNQKRILEIFEEIYKSENNAVLMLIGNGEQKNEIIEIAKKKNILENVLFLDGITNIQDYYQIMDVFLFPSLYEGLGIVLIEAQISGLPCITSDRVPKEVKISDNIKFFSLDDSNKAWAEEIKKYIGSPRKLQVDKTKSLDFDINIQAQNLEKIYFNILGK